MPIPSMYPRNIERGLSNRKGFCWVRPRAHARFLGPFFQLQKACERTHVGGGGLLKRSCLKFLRMYAIFTYIWLILMVKVGRYTSPMHAMGCVLIWWVNSL